MQIWLCTHYGSHSPLSGKRMRSFQNATILPDISHPRACWNSTANWQCISDGTFRLPGVCPNVRSVWVSAVFSKKENFALQIP
jgi:hypothetical protein